MKEPISTLREGGSVGLLLIIQQPQGTLPYHCKGEVCICMCMASSLVSFDSDDPALPI